MKLTKRQQNLVSILEAGEIFFRETEKDVATNLEKYIKNNIEIPCFVYYEHGKLGTILDSILKSKTQGLCESYIQGHIFFKDEKYDYFELLRHFALTPFGSDKPIIDQIPNSTSLIGLVLINRIFNLPYLKQFQVAKEHYDLPPELFTGVKEKFDGMLGHTYKYTCGDWNNIPHDPKNLNQAQLASLNYIFDELELGQKTNPVILDCGCGWGTIAQHLFETLGEGNFTYIGVTIAQNQVDDCKMRFAEKRNIHFFNHSFNDPFDEIFTELRINKLDAIIFLGSLEHAGPTGAQKILENVRPLLMKNGKMYIQIVGAEHQTPLLDPYIWKYIFPNTVIMSPQEIGKFCEHNRYYRMEKMDNTWYSYYLTLMAWYDHFTKNWNSYEPCIASIIDQTQFKTTQEWKKHWESYLLLCAAFYQVGSYPQLYRITLSPNLDISSKVSLRKYLVRFLQKFINI
jgi:cyclopropane-fatty-acyl-phospholipid synthase